VGLAFGYAKHLWLMQTKKHLSEAGGGEAWAEDLRLLLRHIEYSQRELARDFRRVAELYAQGGQK